MNGRHFAVILILAVAFAAGSFVMTYAWQPPTATGPSRTEAPCSTMPGCSVGCCKSLASWLGLESKQVRQVEQITREYSDKRIKLESTLFAERQKLAELFDNDTATDEEILQQVERVIEADSLLERCVVAHLVALRPHLTSKQRTQLYQRCAKGVRNAGGCQWRHSGQDGPGCGGRGTCTDKQARGSCGGKATGDGSDKAHGQPGAGGCRSQPSGCGSRGFGKDARSNGIDGG